MVWYKLHWVNHSIWRGYGVDPMRPTENAAFKNLFNQSLYGEYLRWLYK